MNGPTGFAEMFLWYDGNPNNEDRAGMTVVLEEGDKVRVADKPYDARYTEQIIGVIGGDNTSVSAISNASPEEWHGKHLRDPFNRLLWEPQVMVEWIVDGFRHWYEADRIPEGVVVPANATYYRNEWNGYKLQRQILSEEFKNPGKPVAPYLPRWERQEWAIVILLGRAVVRNNQLTNPGWKKIRSISDGTVALSEWLIK
jgi:hypothetical protein